MKLHLLEGQFAVCRLPATAHVEQPKSPTAFFSITRTRDELSVVCEESLAPAGSTIESGWRCISVVGRIPFETIGVLASLTRPLADAGISVFAISTFDTDYLMWKDENTVAAREALLLAGFEFEK